MCQVEELCVVRVDLKSPLSRRKLLEGTESRMRTIATGCESLEYLSVSRGNSEIVISPDAGDIVDGKEKANLEHFIDPKEKCFFTTFRVKNFSFSVI